MSGPVDVLSFLDDSANAFKQEGWSEAVVAMGEARAAIAALIEAAADICYEVSDRSDGKKSLVAALARVKGESQ